MEDKTYICENCGTEVMASETKCPKCGELFEETIDNVVIDNNIMKNVNNLLLIGRIINGALIAFSIIAFISLLTNGMSAENDSDEGLNFILFLIYILVPAVGIFEGFVLENYFKQKAYMLYTNNEIMKKLK